MRDGERRRVVVTGLGMITPLGGSVAKTWDGIRAGRSGIGQTVIAILVRTCSEK